MNLADAEATTNPRFRLKCGLLPFHATSQCSSHLQGATANLAISALLHLKMKTPL